MPTLQELRDTRAAAWAKAQEFKNRAAAGQDMSAEDETAWTRALDEVDTIGGQIETRERTEALDKRFDEIDEQTRAVTVTGDPADSRDEYSDVFQRFCRYGMGDLTVEERQLLRNNFQQVEPESRAQGAGTGSAGGYTVPQGFWAKVTETMKYFGGAADGADMLNTDTGGPLPWPTNDDTSVMGYQLGENTEASSEGDLAFGQKTLGAYTYVSGAIRASLQIIQDSGIDIESFIARRMGERLGRIQNLRFTTGTGSSQPQGYITGATTGKTTASATVITYDEIIDLIHSVDAAYRASGRCRFKLHDLILAKVRKLRDDSGGAGVGRPLWEPSIQAGVPDLLLGYPYTINNDQASAVTTGLKTMWFGDPTSAFAVRKVNGASMMRLEERYAEYLQVGFIGYERADALVQDASAGKLLVQA